MNIAENIDCMKAMKKLPDKPFDIAVFDPTYFSSAAEAAASLHWSLDSILWGTKLTSTTTKRRKGALRNAFHKGVCFCRRCAHEQDCETENAV